MAKNSVFNDSENLRRTVYVGKGIAPGTPLIYGGQPGVTITGSGDFTSTETATFGPLTIGVASKGGVGLHDGQATVAFDGSIGAVVEGINSFDDAFTVNTTTLARTPKPVYITAAGVLTTTATDNTFFGIVDDYRPNDPEPVIVKFGVKEIA